MGRIAESYVADEARVIPLLHSVESVSGCLFRRLSITRSAVAAVLGQLRYSRAIQATFCSKVCASRFKLFEQGLLELTICQFRGQIGSLDYLISCVNISKPPKNSDQLALYLVELATRANNVNPHMPAQHMIGSDAGAL